MAWPDRDDFGGVVGCALVDSAVGTVAVVVLDVLDEQCSELVLVQDDRAVEKFVAECADPSFGVGVRLGCPGRDPFRGDPGAGEHVVERAVNCAAPSRMRNLNP